MESSDPLIVSAKGTNGVLDVFNDRIRIRREGFTSFVLFGSRGNKEISYRKLSAIQFKEPGTFTAGFIQFAFSGSGESKGGLMDATKDENTVMFNQKTAARFREAKRLIEEKMEEASRPAPTRGTISIADELQKLATLRDQGILSESEFQTQKAKLLR